MLITIDELCMGNQPGGIKLCCPCDSHRLRHRGIRRVTEDRIEIAFSCAEAECQPVLVLQRRGGAMILGWAPC